VRRAEAARAKAIGAEQIEGTGGDEKWAKKTSTLHPSVPVGDHRLSSPSSSLSLL